jgi:hypothetical protein
MTEFEVFPSLMEWPDASLDIARVELDVERLRLVSKVASFRRLSSLGHIRDLWCFDINDENLAAIGECQSLRRLYIDGLKVSDLSSVVRLLNLQVLSLDSCSWISNLEFLRSCSVLKGLGIINFKNVRSVEEIGRLKDLRVLAIAGSMWTQMIIRTLGPLSGLAKLEELDLSNTKVMDESLRPLGELRALRSLNIANFYPMEEFAWLSSRLKNATCTWFSPYIDFEVSRCKKCGGKSMVMLAGKGMPKLCKACDRSRLARHVESFEAAARL